MEAGEDEVAAEDLASKTPARKTTVNWAAAVDRRLDQLVDRAIATEPERSDLLAALVAAAPTDSDKLDRLVTRWRKRRVRQVVLGVPDDEQRVALPRYTRGRRPSGRG